MSEHPQLEAALRYAAIGWHVFPVTEERRPMVATGFHAAVVDEAQIREWWTKWPTAGIGVACLLSGIFVVDLDRNHANARDGVDSWEFLQQDFGDDERGLMASTPRGGQHIVYMHPGPGSKVKTVNNVIADTGIDCRGDGGYFVAPSPSDPGRQWEEGDPIDCDDNGVTCITTAPKWVLDIMLVGRGPSSSAGVDTGKAMTLNDDEVARIRSALACIPNDDYSIWVQVGMALRSTFAKSQAYTLWTEWSSKDYGAFDDHKSRVKWQSFRELRFDGSEVSLGSLFYQASENGWVDTSGLPEVESTPSEDSSGIMEDIERGESVLPVDLINTPGIVGEMAHYIGYINRDFPQPALGYGAALAIVSALMGSIVRTEDGRFSHLYIVGLGGSGCGKDASKNAISSLLNEVEMGDIVASSDWTSDAALRRELSPEMNTEANKKHGRVAAVDEFGDWLSVANDASNANKRQMRSLFMEVWGSSTDKIIQGVAYANDGARPTIDLTAPCLTIYGVSTPEKVYESLGSRSNMDGLTNRLLFIRVDNDIPDSATEDQLKNVLERGKIVNRLKEVANWLRPMGYGGLGVGGFSDIIATYTDDAKVRMKEIGEEVKTIRREEAVRGSQSDGAGLWVRAPESIRRVATVLAAGEMTEEVNIHHIKLAESFVRWSIEKTKSGMSTAGGDNEHESLQRKVLKELKKKKSKGCSKAELARALRSSTAKQRGEAVAHLVEAGDVVEEREDSSGRPVFRYKIRR